LRSTRRTGRASSRSGRWTRRCRFPCVTSSSRTRLTVVGEGDAGLLPGFAAGMMAHRAEKQFRKDFERLKRLLEP
jgi:hypothetical protein